MLVKALQFLAVPIAVLAYYAAFFMCDSVEGEWQSRIEKFWVDVDDRARLSGTKTVALFNAVARVVTRGFNRVFGRKVLSFQLVGVSSSYSFAGMFLIMGFCLMYFDYLVVSRAPHPLSETMAKGFAAAVILGILALLIGFILLVIAALPSLWPTPLTIGLSLLPALFWIGGVVKLVRLHADFRNQLSMLIALLVSVLSDVLLLAIVRIVIRRLSGQTSISKIAAAALTQIFVLALLVVVPLKTFLLLAERTGNGDTPSSMFAFSVAAFNVFTGLACSVFVLVLFVVLLHKLLWPMLSRLVYPLARFRVVHNHKLMASVGTGCLIFAFPLMRPTIKSVLEWFAK
jgi:hypothetical protein